MICLTLGGGIAPLYIACVVGGLAYGSINMLFPAILSEVFGLALFPILYTLISGLAFSLGSLIMSTLVYGSLFDAALLRHGLEATQPCRFADCYSTAVYICATVSATSALICLIFAFLTKEDYAQYQRDGRSPTQTIAQMGLM